MAEPDFLNNQKLKEELVPLLEQTFPKCKQTFSAAVEKALKRMVDFTELLEVSKGKMLINPYEL